MPVTVVQILWTEWTKASRGGEGARRRNAVPEALPLPDQLIAGQGAYRLHVTCFAEGPWLGLHSTELKGLAAQNTVEWSQRLLEKQAQATGLDRDAAAVLRRLGRERPNLTRRWASSEGRWLRRLEKKFRAIQLLGDFTPAGWWEESDDPTSLQRTEVNLTAGEGCIAVSLGSRELFTVCAGEWGRVRYNRRHSLAHGGWNYEGGWSYSKTVVNVGLFDEPRADVFTSTAPAHEASRMVDLR